MIGGAKMSRVAADFLWADNFAYTHALTCCEREQARVKVIGQFGAPQGILDIL